MGALSLFLKKNKKERPNTFFAATKSIAGEDGKPALWEIRPLTTEEDERIREECTEEVSLPGRRGQYRTRVRVSEYLAKQMAAAVVYPDLYDAELQDSYGVKTPEALLRAMVDDPGEYAALGNYIREQSGFGTDMDEEIEQAKN